MGVSTAGLKDFVRSVCLMPIDTDCYSKTFNGSRDIDWALHVARNPWGWSEDDVREARLMVCDRLERLQKQLAQEQATVATLEARVKWLMTR